MIRRLPALLLCIVSLHLFSCDDNDPVSPDSELNGNSNLGTVQGYVTFRGDSISGVEIRTSSATLAKRNKSGTSATASRKTGYYRLELESGTHELVFSYYPRYSQEYDSRITASRTVEVFPDSVLYLDVEMTASGWGTDLYARALSDNRVQLDWRSYEADGYDVYRSSNKNTWLRLSPLGESTYSSLQSSLYDTVPEMGIYYYRMEFLDTETGEKYQSDTVEVEVLATPFVPEDVFLMDSLFFVYGKVYLQMSRDTTKAIEVLRSKGRADNFQKALTIGEQGLSSPEYYGGSSYPRSYLEFRDSVETGVYFYRFLARSEDGTISDTSRTYSIDFRGPAVMPALELHDSVTYVHVEVHGPRTSVNDIKAVLYRSIGDTNHFTALDTVNPGNNRSNYESYYDGTYAEFVDLDAPIDTLYYKAHWIYNTNLAGTFSEIRRIVLDGKLDPPSLLRVSDSGKTIGISLLARYSYAPVILYRIDNQDTTAIDTVHCPKSEYHSQYECELSDAPGREGYFLYAAAHLALDGTVGKMSKAKGTYTTNKLRAPSLRYDTRSLVVELTIGKVSGATMYVLERHRDNSDTPEFVDTLSPYFGYYDRTTEYDDTLLQSGYYSYNVSAISTEGEVGQPANVSFYFTPRLSSPPSFQIEERGTGRVRISISENSSTPDSIVIERSSLSNPGFTVIEKVESPDRYYSSSYFYDTLTQSGMYSYRIKRELGSLESAYSEPKTIEITLPLQTPTGVTLDSLQNGIRITWQEVPKADGYYIYRSTEYYYGITNIANVSAPTTSFLDTNQTRTDVYGYRISAHKNGVESQLSSEKQIHYTVD